MAKNARNSSMCSMNFFYCKDRSIEPSGSSVRPTTSCAVVHKKLDGAATRLMSGVTAVFFASLERCSCINIATKDDVDDGGTLPLILSDVIYPATDGIYPEKGGGEEHDMVDGVKDVIHAATPNLN